jgi:hypothetical protein
MTSGKRSRQRSNATRERRIFVRGIRRDEPDLPKLARALLALAQREADAAKGRTDAEDQAPPTAAAEEGESHA